MNAVPQGLYATPYRRSWGGLTLRQQQCVEFLRRYSAEKGFGVSPSYDEIAAALNVKSKSGVNRLVNGLEERGWIVRMAKKARSISLVEEPLFQCPKCGHQFQSNGQ